jgi:prepilin-type processing-associated H-X9-DG protein
MLALLEDTVIGLRSYKAGQGIGPPGGFTLIELLLVVSTVSLLMAILLPALGKVRYEARTLVGMNNMRQVVAGVNNYTLDNGQNYPESVATITFGSNWHWQEPRMMAACKPRPSMTHRSMSAFLGSYIRDARTMFCPNAPRRYEYFQLAWDTGDEWDNPETSFLLDPLFGTYCFYWNYVGFLGEDVEPFTGPRHAWGGHGQSPVLVSDYFGYDHHRSPNAYGSCEKFRRATVTLGTEVSAAYWSCLDSEVGASLDSLRLNAGYVDGHVGSFKASETLPMQVSIAPDGTVPYPSGVGLGPGDFYLPRDSLR